MHPAVVTGGAVRSRILHVGQAPGDKEPKLGRPFAWTAGRTLFGWFQEALGWSEADYRSRIYMAAVCRCFPGKRPGGGDRVPDPAEIANCASWLQREIEILRPALVLPIGKLAIAQFMEVPRLDTVIGQQFALERYGHTFDLIPLPHPSGASPWHRVERFLDSGRVARHSIAARKKQRHQDGQQQTASVRHAVSFVSCDAQRQRLKPRRGAPRRARAHGAEASFPVPSGARAMRPKDAEAG